MAKGILVAILGGAVVIVVAVVVVVEFGLVPANADARPPSLERWAATTALHATIRRQASKGPNPLAVSDANFVAGINIYAANCAVCHGGPDGRPSDIAEGLYQKPPQLARHGVEDDPAGHTYWKISNGIRWTGMPSFAHTLSEHEIWQVTLFLEHMDALPPAAEAAWRQVPSSATAPEAPVTPPAPSTETATETTPPPASG